MTLTLHQQHDRHRIYRSLGPFFFDETLGCLCVFDPEIIAEVFRSDRFRVIAFADQYRYITEHTPLDFEATATAFDHVPLANEGARHKKLRAEMASIIADPSRQKALQMDAFVTARVTHLFSAGSAFDLVEDLAGPLFVKLFTLWLGVDHEELAQDSTVSQVFDMKLSLNRRKKLNEDVAQLTCAFAKQRDQLATSPEIATAMNILGNDTLKGSFALSVWEILSRNPGARLSEIDYPENIPSTGVPFIERVALEDLEIAGMKVAKGQRVRLVIDATALHVSGVESDLLFGRGRHLCLGKPMTLAIWRRMTKTLSSIPHRYTVGDMKMRTGDYAFNYPEFARVTIHD